jgi:hypothetical protein
MERQKEEPMKSPTNPTIRPMTRRGPDGRPHETAEMEPRAAEAQKAGAETPRRPPTSVVGNPD